ncbi:MAG TPA: putative lipid II flippase FtsW [Planctomycetota bacterium]|jgi:cell division protein FtsW|nr:putative lipid II flippase FtsW [Planctomycetota bacterium]
MSRNAVIVVALSLALVAIGVVMLYSATAVMAEKSPRYNDSTWFLKRQLVWVLLGIAAMIVTARVPYTFWERWRIPVLIGALVLLGLVFVPHVGVSLNAARRWIRVGGFFFQPSEAAKIAIAVFLAGFAAKDPERMKKFLKGFVPAFATLGLCCAMIIVEPDVGTSVFVAIVMTSMLVVAGVRAAHLVPCMVLAGCLASYYAVTHTDHVMARLETWLHPERDPLGKGHQILQSKMALGAGGLWGEGLGRGLAKLYFLPEAHSDFIFPVIGEELGFIGTTFVVLLYVALGFAGYAIMRRTKDRFGFLLAFSLTTYIILQAAMNVAVVTAAMPTKGIPLPFVSAGGSSVLFTLAGVGMLVSIANASERGTCPEGDGASCLPAVVPAATSSPA